MAEKEDAPAPPMPVVEKNRMIGRGSIGDLVKSQISEIEMEAAATLEYAA